MASPDPTLRPPAVPAPRGGPAPPRPAPLLGPTTASALLVGATCLAALLDAWATWYRHGVAVEYAAGVPGVWVADLTSAESTSRSVGVLYLLAMAAAAIALLVWLSRVRTNNRLLGRPPHPLWRRLALAGWFAVTAVATASTVLPGADAAVAELAALTRVDSVTALAQCVAGVLVVAVVRQATPRTTAPGAGALPRPR